METFFSTVAQISFTIVGLFFVALTVDSETRDYWFGQSPHNRYAYLNFLVMLLPGFLSLGGLINIGDDKSMPSWPFVSVFLVILYIVVYIALRRLKKDPNYKQVVELEHTIGLSGLVFLDTFFLLLLSIFGAASSYVHNAEALAQQEILLKILICSSTISNVFPVMVFARSFVEKRRNSLSTNIDVAISETNARPKQARENSSGIISLMLLITALFSFFIGWFFQGDQK